MEHLVGRPAERAALLGVHIQRTRHGTWRSTLAPRTATLRHKRGPPRERRLELAALAADGPARRGLGVLQLERLDRTHERLADRRRGGRLRAAQREEQRVRELERRQQVLGLEAVAREESEQLRLQRRHVRQQAGGGGAERVLLLQERREVVARLAAQVGVARLAHVLHHEGCEAPAQAWLAAHQLVGEARVEPAVLLRVELGQRRVQRRHQLARQLRRTAVARGGGGAGRGGAGHGLAGGRGRLAIGPLAAARLGGRRAGVGDAAAQHVGDARAEEAAGGGAPAGGGGRDERVLAHDAHVKQEGLHDGGGELRPSAAELLGQVQDLLQLEQQRGGRQRRRVPRVGLRELQLAQPVAQQRAAAVEERLLLGARRVLSHRVEQRPRQQQQQRRGRLLTRHHVKQVEHAQLEVRLLKLGALARALLRLRRAHHDGELPIHGGHVCRVLRHVLVLLVLLGVTALVAARTERRADRALRLTQLLRGLLVLLVLVVLIVLLLVILVILVILVVFVVLVVVLTLLALLALLLLLCLLGFDHVDEELDARLVELIAPRAQHVLAHVARVPAHLLHHRQEQIDHDLHHRRLAFLACLGRALAGHLLYARLHLLEPLHCLGGPLQQLQLQVTPQQFEREQPRALPPLRRIRQHAQPRGQRSRRLERRRHLRRERRGGWRGGAERQPPGIHLGEQVALGRAHGREAASAAAGLPVGGVVGGGERRAALAEEGEEALRADLSHQRARRRLRHATVLDSSAASGGGRPLEVGRGKEEAQGLLWQHQRRRRRRRRRALGSTFGVAVGHCRLRLHRLTLLAFLALLALLALLLLAAAIRRLRRLGRLAALPLQLVRARTVARLLANLRQRLAGEELIDRPHAARVHLVVAGLRLKRRRAVSLLRRLLGGVLLAAEGRGEHRSVLLLARGVEALGEQLAQRARRRRSVVAAAAEAGAQ
eukprot:scaffold17787_cov56-Phaeocystis_antarctica.AAC.4